MDFYKSLVNPPLVIFTTAYSEYALEGFEVEAIDYLLKPFSYSRFLKAINKAEKQLDNLQENNHISLKADKKIHRINLSNITKLESVGDYVKVFYADQSILVHDTLQNLLEKLPSSQFIRIHKSYAINFSKVEAMEGNLIYINKIKVPIGATYKMLIKDKLNL